VGERITADLGTRFSSLHRNMFGRAPSVRCTP